jgi:hypothetical protein
MKTMLATLMIILPLGLSAQKSFYGRAAGAYSTIKNDDISVTEGLGYIVGVGFTDIVTPHLTFTSELYYFNQHSKINDFDLSVKSIHLLIGTRISPAKAFHFLTAIQPGQTIGIRIDGETTTLDKHLQLNVVGGIGYDIGEKLTLDTRFVTPVHNRQEGYDYNIQLGINYRF